MIEISIIVQTVEDPSVTLSQWKAATCRLGMTIQFNYFQHFQWNKQALTLRDDSAIQKAS